MDGAKPFTSVIKGVVSIPLRGKGSHGRKSTLCPGSAYKVSIPLRGKGSHGHTIPHCLIFRSWSFHPLAGER